MQSTASTQSQVLETVQKKTSPSPHYLTSESMKNPVLWISGSFLVAFVAMAISDGNLLSSWVNNGFSFSAGYLAPFGRSYCLQTLSSDSALLLVKLVWYDLEK